MDEKKQKLLITIPAVILITAVVMTIVLLVVRAFMYDPYSDISPAGQFVLQRDFLFEEKLRITGRGFGLTEDNFSVDLDLEQRQTVVTIRFPRARLVEEFVMQIFAVVENSDYTIAESKHITRGRTVGRREFVRMEFENRRRPNERIVTEIIVTNEAVRPDARAAFIVRGFENLSADSRANLLKLGEAFNFVVSSSDTNTQVFERLLLPVLIEIPMDCNTTPIRRTRYTIRQSDSRSRMGETLARLQRRQPSAVGFIANSGNLVLNSPNTARDFLQNIRRRRVVFVDARSLDGRASRNLTAQEISREIGAFYHPVNIWLPAENAQNLSVAAWEAEIRGIGARMARSRNSVVHIIADDNFVEALTNSLPYIRERGIRIVPIIHL